MREKLEEIAQEAKIVVDKIMKDLDGYALVSYGYSPEMFRNSALGLPEPKKAYAQVMTPGFILDLHLKKTDGNPETRLYHSNKSGSIIIEDKKRTYNI